MSGSEDRTVKGASQDKGPLQPQNGDERAQANPPHPPETPPGDRETLARLRRRLRRQNRELAAKDRQIEALRSKLGRSGSRDGRLRPENVVWIFGTSRVGSTWLARMMGEVENFVVWDEPLIGELFGHLYYVRADHRRGRHFILGDRYKESWRGAMRSMVLDGVEDRFPRLGDEDYAVVKEPNGSIGAPLLMQALPESRIIALMRDPRDVAASSLDAAGKGSWFYENQRKRVNRDRILTDETATLVNAAKKYVRYVGKAVQAYTAHEGPKALVRYEELRADTLGTMRRLYAALDIPANEDEIERAVEARSWERIPEQNRGEGRFHRKATPGGWREDLTDEQVKVVEEITAPILDEYYRA